MSFYPLDPFFNLFLVNPFDIMENLNNLIIGLLLFGMECFHLEFEGLLSCLQGFLPLLQCCDGFALVFNRILECSELFALPLDARLECFLSLVQRFDRFSLLLDRLL